jgi:hypothetical protein
MGGIGDPFFKNAPLPHPSIVWRKQMSWETCPPIPLKKLK